MDVAEFEQFLEIHEKDIFSFCRSLAMDVDRASDLYQDTVLAAFEMRERIKVSQNPKALFLSIAVGKWRNTKRKAGRRQAIAPELPLDGLNEQVLPVRSEGPESLTQSKLLKETIQDALAVMDDKFRIPLILHYFDEYDLSSIAQICKTPKGTIKSRLHKGRALLKKALESM